MSNAFSLSASLAALLLVATGTACAAAVETAVEKKTGDMPASVEKVIGEAAAEGLPVQGLKAKAAEGMAKRVSPESLACACRARLEALRKAHELVGPDAAHRILVESIGRCLESGLDPKIVREIVDLAATQSIPPGRLAGVIDAGEDAWLSGLGAEEVRDLMKELIRRGASRRECHLAVERAGQLKGEGNQGESLKQRLWGKCPSPGCPESSRGDHKGNGHPGGGGGCGGPGPARGCSDGSGQP